MRHLTLCSKEIKKKTNRQNVITTRKINKKAKKKARYRITSFKLHRSRTKILYYFSVYFIPPPAI